MADTSDDFSQFPEAGTVAPSSAADEFSQFPEANQTPSFGEQAAVAAETGARGAIESASITGSTVAGIGVGAAAAPFLGPFAPAGPVLGGLGGFAYGLYAGESASEALGLRSPEQLPQELRPAGYFGQSVGGATTFIAAPFAAAASGFRFGGVGMQEGKSVVGNFLNQVIETAKAKPVLTLTGELSSAVSAGAGAYLGEQVAPGQEGYRVAAETAGGLLNPTRLTIDAATYVYGLGKKVVTSMSPAGQQTAAAKTLSDLFRATKEDPAIVAKILREQGVVKTEQTAAQKTGSMALAALEDHLAKKSTQFGAEAGQKARDALDDIRMMTDLLAKTGDPAAIQAAAEARSVYFRTLIQGRLDSATDDATKAAAKITADTPAARQQISIAAREAIELSIKDARAAESALWKAIDGTKPVDYKTLQQVFDTHAAELLPEIRNEKMPVVVRNFLNRVNAPKAQEQSLIILPENVARRAPVAERVGTNAGEMRQLRSELLDQARMATNAGDYGQARIFNNLAEAVVDDMDTAFKDAGDMAYDEARAFSREFNDTFTRSFVGKVSSQGRYGDRVAPELTLQKALATGKEAGAIQLQELEEATRFMQVRGLGDDGAAKQMMDAQDRIIRLAAADAVNPQSGRVNPTKIAKFVRDNEVLMNRFPEVKADLLAASTSETARKSMEMLAKGQVGIIEKQKAFGRMLSSDPVTMASRALLSNTQEKDLIDLINIAKPGYKPRGGVPGVEPKEAIDGLRASVFTAAANRSRDRNNTLNLAQFRGLLFTPNVPGQKSAIQVMQENGVVDAAQVKQMRQLLDAADAVVRSQTAGTAVEINLGIGDAALVTISRMIGSGAAGATAKAVGSDTPSLIVNGAGARFAEQVITKLPTKSETKFLIDAMNDPAKMALLLEKVDTPAQNAMQARRIHAWLVQSGLAAVTGDSAELDPVQESEYPLSP